MTGRIIAADAVRRRRAPAAVPEAAAAPGNFVPALGAHLVTFYLVIEYLRPQYYFSPLNFAKFGVMACTFGVVYLLFAKRHRIPAMGWLLLLFVALLYKTVPFAAVGPRAFWTTTNLATMCIGGPLLMMVALDSVERLRRATWLYCVLGFVLAIQGIRHGGRGVGGFFTDENDLGMALCTVLPIAYFHALTTKKIATKIVGFGGVLLCIISIMASLSRGGFLGLAAVVFHIIINSRRKVAGFLSILLVGLIALAFVPPTYYSEMASIETSTKKGDTGEQRLYMWGVAYKVFQAYPIMGVGADNYPMQAPMFEDRQRVAEGLHLWGKACHSVYFTLLPEAGVPGTLVWLLMLLLGFHALRRVARVAKPLCDDSDPARAEKARWMFALARGIEGGTIGYLVTGAFLSVLYYPNVWTLFGLMAATWLTAGNEGLLPAGTKTAR